MGMERELERFWIGEEVTEEDACGQGAATVMRRLRTLRRMIAPVDTSWVLIGIPFASVSLPAIFLEAILFHITEYVGGSEVVASERLEDEEVIRLLNIFEEAWREESAGNSVVQALSMGSPLLRLFRTLLTFCLSSFRHGGKRLQGSMFWMIERLASGLRAENFMQETTRRLPLFLWALGDGDEEFLEESGLASFRDLPMSGFDEWHLRVRKIVADRLFEEDWTIEALGAWITWMGRRDPVPCNTIQIFEAVLEAKRAQPPAP